MVNILIGPPGPVDSSQAEYASMMSQMLASLSANQRDSQSYALYQSDQSNNQSRENKPLKNILLNQINTRKIGDKINPAKSCEQIIENYPETKSGYYFIDPAQNGEPIHVFCNSSSGQTCIEPAQIFYNVSLTSIHNDDKEKV
jgi:hypothetical protein